MKLRNPKYSVLLAGLIAWLLYAVLFSAGLDAKGLPVMSHWSHIALWALTAVTGVAILLISRSIRGPEDYSSAYPASVSSAVGCLAAAVSCFVFSTPSAQAGTTATVDMVLRGVAGAALCALAYCRYAGRRPTFALHSVVCLYLAFRMICQYRYWSPDPQIVQYCFYLGAYVALMLACYHLAAFDAGFGSHKALWRTGLAAVYLCFLSLSGPQERLFMLACGIWMLTNLSSLKPAKPDSAAEEV